MKPLTCQPFDFRQFVLTQRGAPSYVAATSLLIASALGCRASSSELALAFSGEAIPETWKEGHNERQATDKDLSLP